MNEFNYIYEEYKNKVTAYVRSKVSDSDNVEDLVSEIFLKIYQNLDKFDETKASLSTWIYTIASRKVTDYYRSRRVHSELPSENGEEGALPLSMVDTEELDSDLIQEETLEELADALGTLKEKERDLIILHYYHGMLLKEVAETMSMSYANAKILHKKALMKLRSQMSVQI